MIPTFKRSGGRGNDRFLPVETGATFHRDRTASKFHFNDSRFIIPEPLMALEANVVQLNHYIKLLIPKVEKVHVLVESKKLFAASEAVSASSVSKSFFSFFF